MCEKRNKGVRSNIAGSRLKLGCKKGLDQMLASRRPYRGRIISSLLEQSRFVLTSENDDFLHEQELFSDHTKTVQCAICTAVHAYC